MQTDQFVAVAGHQTLEFQIAYLLLDGRQGLVDDLPALVGRQSAEHRIDLKTLSGGHPDRLPLIRRSELRRRIVNRLRILIIRLPYTVIDMNQGILVVLYTGNALRAGIIRDPRHVSEIEVAVKVEHDVLMGECLPAVRDAGTVAHLLRTHILEPLTAPQVQHEVLLLRRRLKHARVGKDDGLVLIAVGHPIHHYIIKVSRLQVFLLYIKVGIGNAVIEDPFGYLQLRTFLLHGDEQLGDVLLCARPDVVLEIERTAGDEDTDDDQAAERLDQRDACRLDGRQLGTLAEVAVGYKGRKEYGQR